MEEEVRGWRNMGYYDFPMGSEYSCIHRTGVVWANGGRSQGQESPHKHRHQLGNFTNLTHTFILYESLID